MDINNGFTIQFGIIAPNGNQVKKYLPLTYTNKQYSCVANVFGKQAAGDHTIIWDLNLSYFTASNVNYQGAYFYEPIVFISIGY